MLDITSILSDAIETCGFDAEEYAEEALENFVSDILQEYHIKTMIKDAIDTEVHRRDSDIVDLLEDAVSDYAKDIIENAF